MERGVRGVRAAITVNYIRVMFGVLVINGELRAVTPGTTRPVENEVHIASISTLIGLSNIYAVRVVIESNVPALVVRWKPV